LVPSAPAEVIQKANLPYRHFPFPLHHSPSKEMKWTTCVVVALALAVVAMLASTAHAYPSNVTEIIRDYGYVRPPLNHLHLHLFLLSRRGCSSHHVSFFFHYLLLI
jgi:hypothetical protein